MNRLLLSIALTALAVTAAAQTSANNPLIARAESFEVDMPYVPPPVDPLAHHAGFFTAP